MTKTEETSIQPLDRTDLRILRALQGDGRLTNAELAARVNVSAAEDGQKRLVVPIQGLNSRLGTVVLTYRDPS